MPNAVNNQSYTPSLAERILYTTLLVATVTAGIYTLLILSVIEANMGKVINALVAFISFGSLYYFAKYQHHQWVKNVFLAITLCILIVSWFFANGFLGGVGYYFVMATALFITLLPLKYIVWSLAIPTTTVLVLALIEWYFPSFVVKEPSSDILLFNVVANTILTIVLIAWIFIRYKKEYETEQQKVEQKNEELEAANQIKSTFLTNISHEVRTPINGTIGLTDLLAQTPLNKEQKEYIQGIKQSNQRLWNIITQLLDFSNIDAGKFIYEQTPFEFRAALSELTAKYQPAIANKELSLTVSVDANIPKTLIGDKQNTLKVLHNLLDNAIKFTSKGSVHLQVRLIKKQTNILLLEFEVSDTGIGIAPSKQAHLFDAFTQIDASTTRTQLGTGIGLAICKQIVKRMGGQIWVNSALHQGASFFFTMPFVVTSTAAKTKDAPPNHQADPKLKILLVEDDSINKLVATRLIEQIGFEATTVTNGQEALEKLKHDDFDIIFMDIQMPIMDGIEATKAIRNTPSIKQPIIVAMTANTTKEDQRQCKDVGMNEFIPKPIDKERLRTILNKYALSLNSSNN